MQLISKYFQSSVFCKFRSLHRQKQLKIYQTTTIFYEKKYFTQFTKYFEHKSDISEKKSQKSENGFCICFRTLRIFWGKKNRYFWSFFVKILSILSHIPKTNNLKNVFSSVSEHCATFWSKNPIWQLLRGVGGAVSGESACR